MPAFGVVDDLPQGGEPFGVFGKIARLVILDQIKGKEADVAVAQELVIGIHPRVARGEQRGHFGHRRLVCPLPAKRRGEDLQQAALLLLRGAERGGQLAGIAALKLLGEPGDLSAHIERAQVALQQRLRLGEEAVDPLEGVDADAIAIQPFGLQPGDIDPVLHEAEVSRLPLELFGQLIEDRRHGPGIVAMDDHGHVVLLAEFLAELVPATVRFALGIEQVGAAGAEAEAELCPGE